MPTLNIVGILIVGVLALTGFAITWFIKRQSGGVVPTDEQQWLDKLGLQVLYEAYLEALKASGEPDAQRDIVISYLVAFAESSFGVALPLDIAYFLYEFIADLVATKGETAVAELVAKGASASAMLRKGV